MYRWTSLPANMSLEQPLYVSHNLELKSLFYITNGLLKTIILIGSESEFAFYLYFYFSKTTT